MRQAGSAVFNHTAFADSLNWVKKSPANSPPRPSLPPVMAFDAARGQVVMFGGGTYSSGLLNDTWVWDGTNWTQKNPTNSPPPRQNHGMAYDGARGQVLLFGGFNGSNLNDTWVWDGANWTQKNPANNPSPSFPVVGMAYDVAHGQTVLFVSNPNPFAGSVFSDTWVWDGTNWTKKSPMNSPPPRTSSGMAYDTARAQVVLFGGNDAIGSPSSLLNDTWVWDGTNWTQKNPTNRPTPRYQQAMAYDSTRGQVVLFGGEDGSTPSDTWVWDGTNWAQKNPTNSPSPRNLNGMVYDATRGGVVLFGGTGGSGLLNDTWVYGASSCVTPPPGMVGWWSGENNASDRIGSNPGVVHGGVAFASGMVGQAFNFNGGHVSIGNPPSLKLTSAVTLDAWVKPSDLSEGQEAAIVSKWGQSTSLDSYTIFLRKQNGVSKLVGAIGVANTSDQGFSGGSLPASAWSHVAMTYDSVAGNNVLYVNGEQVATRQWAGGIFTSSVNVLIGREDSFIPRPFFGLIDEVEIFGRALTSQEVQAIYLAGSFGKCAPTPTPHNPLIFIPGITGSRLDIDEPNQHFNVWPGPANYNLLSLSITPPRNIIAPDIFRVGLPIVVGDVYGTLVDRLTAEGYIEYDDGDDPTKRKPEGCLTDQRNGRGEKPTLFVFPYDWRKSNAENVADLDKYVQCVQLIHPGTSVDMLTHSMGGLLARNYIIRSEAPPVKNLITVSTPWLGSTNALYMMEVGKTFWGIRVPIVTSTFKNLAQSFPAVHELLPSNSYFALGGRPLSVNDSPVEYADYKKAINDAYEGDPATNGALFHDAYPGQDDGRVNLKGVNYYHLYGIQDGRGTLESLSFRISTVFCAFGKCLTYSHIVPKMGVGDGTVPELSLSRNNGQANLSAVTPIVFRNSDKNKVEHTDLLKNNEVLATITSALRGTLQLSASIRLTQSAAEQNSNEPMYYLRYNGPTNLTITDSGGASTSPLSDPPTPDLPTTTSYPLGPNSAIVVIPVDQNYTIEFRSEGQPTSLEVTKEGEAPLQAIRYSDLGIPSGVLVRLRLTPQGVEDLRYDGNSDGNFETTVNPTVSITGNSAHDLEPPAVAVSENRQSPNVTVVTVNATDTLSGVKKISYSVDGTNYQTYSAPFSVDPYRVREIYAFADDNVANRSGLVEFQLTAPPPIVMVEQGTTTRAVALDSVTWLRAPFPILNDFNFSADRRTRVILFISGLALTPADLSIVTVQAAGIALPVENVGTVNGVTGLNGSYIVVKLPDGLPAGDLPLTIAVGGVVNSNSVTLGISP